MRESKSPGPARAEADVAGVVSVGCCCLRLAERLTEACGPGMPGPYWGLKEIGAASRDRNPSGAAAPPPFDKGGRGAVCNIIELKLGSTIDTLHECSCAIK